MTNVIITKKEGSALCNRLKKVNIKGEGSVGGNLVPLMFDKILVDAPCSGEGTLRSTAKTAIMWNPNTIKQLSKVQKQLLKSAFEILKPNGILVYSTCTHAPEENEAIIDFAVKELGAKVEKIELPIKCSPGICNWQEDKYSNEVKKACRIYPHVSDTEGFFIAKLRK